MINIAKFTLLILIKEKRKHITIAFILGLILFLLLSFLILAGSIQQEFQNMINQSPDISVYREVGGRIETMPEEWIDEIADIKGIRQIGKLVSGIYRFNREENYFTIIGTDFFGNSCHEYIEKIIERQQDISSFLENDSMIIGSAVKQIFEKYNYVDQFHFYTSSGERVPVKIFDTIREGIELETNDIILLPLDLAKRILGIPPERITDIAINVGQPFEIPLISQKIKDRFPDLRMHSREQLKNEKMKLYHFKSGLFILLFLNSFLAFAVLLFTKASSLSSEQIQRIRILRISGWSIQQILVWKSFEAIIFTVITYCMALMGSVFYIFQFKAPILKEILLGNANLEPMLRISPHIRMDLLFFLFCFILFLYLLASLIPAWKAAISDIKGAGR